MKKALLLSLMLFVGAFVYAQSTIYVNQGFGSMPPTGWTIDAHSTNWSSASGANAGGSSPEARFSYSPDFTGDSRLISPSFDLTGVTTLYLTFKHFVNHYQSPYTLGVATRASGGAWHTVWSINPTGDVGPVDVFVNINNGDQSSSDFQFCIYFSGAAYNIDYWYIDDVVLYAPCAVDGALTKINTQAYQGQGNVNITGSFKNMGASNITGADINYKIGAGGAVQTTNLTGVNITPGSTSNFTCSQAWAATPGNYNVYVWLTNVNGAGADCDQDNDTLMKAISIASQSVTRLPCFEEFTSSTCAPCASFNTSTFTPFVTANPDEFSLVKYQMSWPTTTQFPNGDPYYTTEGGTRRTYYGVSAVPKLYVDGAVCATTSTALNNALSAQTAKSTFFTITTTPTYSGNDITIPVTIMPYISGSFRVYVVVVEKTTTGNVATNGETSFKNVMMKMLPNANGSTISFTDGTVYNNTFNYTHSSSDNIEQMTDLQVVVFIQEYASKEIFQSGYADIGVVNIGEIGLESIQVYPNPASDVLNITNAAGMQAQIYNIYGELIISQQIDETDFTFSTTGLPAGNYILKLTGEDQSISKKISIIR